MRDVAQTLPFRKHTFQRFQLDDSPHSIYFLTIHCDEEAFIQEKDDIPFDNVFNFQRMFVGVESIKYKGNEVLHCVILLSEPLVLRSFCHILFQGLYDFPLFNLISLVGCQTH